MIEIGKWKNGAGSIQWVRRWEGNLKQSMWGGIANTKDLLKHHMKKFHCGNFLKYKYMHICL